MCVCVVWHSKEGLELRRLGLVNGAWKSEGVYGGM